MENKKKVEYILVGHVELTHCLNELKKSLANLNKAMKKIKVQKVHK